MRKAAFEMGVAQAEMEGEKGILREWGKGGGRSLAKTTLGWGREGHPRTPEFGQRWVKASKKKLDSKGRWDQMNKTYR